MLKVCLVCKKEYWSPHKPSKFCSRSCVAKHYNHLKAGKNHSRWKGGKVKQVKGYSMTLIKSGCGKERTKYQFTHRKIMEDFLGRKLLSNEVIHHKDGDIGNNNISNLTLCKDNGEHRRIHSKSIKQYEKDGTFIKEWESTRVASNELLINRTNISQTLSNHRTSAGGYKWSY